MTKKDKESESNIYSLEKLLRFSPKVNNNNKQSLQTANKSYKSKNKKQTNKNICPFACPTCQSLGGDLVNSKYEIVNILSDTGDSIFSPMHEQYHDDDDYRSIRNSGKVFLSADFVDSLFQSFKK